jgi:hypothetical protein
MEEKFNILDSLKKTAKPEVPANFFNAFSDELSAKIANEELSLNKKEMPAVPEGFFESFSDNLMETIAAEESANLVPPKESRTKVIILRILGTIAAAACLLLAFNLIDKEDEIIQTVQVAASTEEEAEDAYLAYLDEDEMINFLIENEDIALEDNELDLEDEDIFYFLDDDIEDYYYDEL